MDFIQLDINKATESQLIEAINNNIITTQQLTSEIQKLKLFLQDEKTSIKTTKEIIINPFTNEKKSNKDEVFEEEVLYYYEILKSTEPAEIIDQIKNIVPISDNLEYKRILHRIQLEMIKNINEIKTFIKTEELTEEDISYLEEEILEYKLKIDEISKYLGIKTKLVKQNNKLFYASDIKGNIGFLEDIEKISIGEYPKISKLLTTIKEGTFENDTIIKEPELGNIEILPTENIRIAFSRLTDDKYAIISISLDDKNSYNNLLIKCLDYKMIESKLINNLENEEYLSLNSQYEQEIIEKLSPSQQKVSIKNKVGDKK